MTSATTIVRHLKEENQDFEWYPTTNEILNSVKTDLLGLLKPYDSAPSVLDIGAGDGRSLVYLTEGKRYAIELSSHLVSTMDSSIFVIGADFQQQTLIDKKVDVIFCNPPYSRFVEFSHKIITEANAKYVYLVIPTRWKENETITDTIKRRKAEYTVVGTFDFISGDRQARAVVDIVRIDLASYRNHQNKHPFSLWFDENFPAMDKAQNEYSEHAIKEGVKNSLVAGGDVVSALESLYQAEFEKLLNNYKAICSMDSALFKEIGLEISGIKESLQLKIKNIKFKYWKELFDNLSSITDRLTSATRKKLLDELHENTSVDFTAKNAHMVALWVVKNANNYFEQQLCDLVLDLTDQDSVRLYKSNTKTFGNDYWRYTYRHSPDNKATHFMLDYRIVAHRKGGIVDPNSWYSDRSRNNLTKSANEFIGDIITVAGNLGFDISNTESPESREWESGKKQTFYFMRNGKNHVLFEVKAFKNGNQHFKFNQELMCKLNVEFGRINGWLKDKAQAVYETGYTPDDIDISFNSNLIMSPSNLKRLGCGL